MDEPRSTAAREARQEPGADWDRAFAAVVCDIELGARQGLGDELRCVSKGYLEHGCSCTESVPLATVSSAWRGELLRGGAGNRFFRFAWKDEVWLAYGLADGGLRGVYCPAHRLQRDGRAFAAG